MSAGIILRTAAAGVIILASIACAQRKLDELEERLESLPAPAVASDGAFLGVTANEALGRGVLVETVTRGGPADLAGVRPGDTIVAVGGRAIRRFDDLATALQAAKPGAKIDVDFNRSGTVYRAAVTLGARPGTVAERRPVGVPLPPTAGPKLGVIVGAVTPEDRARYDLIVSSGALVKTVEPDSVAAVANIPVGAVIVAIDGRRISGPNELTAQVSGLRPGQEIEITFYERATLRKKRVTMGASEPTEAPKDEPGGAALDELERRLGEPTPPVPPVPDDPPLADDPPIAPPSPPVDERSDDDLKLEVQRLRAELSAMQERLEKLEKRLRDRSK